jgi:hypothetical protein
MVISEPFCKVNEDVAAREVVPKDEGAAPMLESKQVIK